TGSGGRAGSGSAPRVAAVGCPNFFDRFGKGGSAGAACWRRFATDPARSRSLPALPSSPPAASLSLISAGGRGPPESVLASSLRDRRLPCSPAAPAVDCGSVSGFSLGRRPLPTTDNR